MQYAVRQQEELINNQRLREYEDELRNKQRINDIIVTNRMEAELEASKLRKSVIEEELAHQDYLRKLDHLRVERSHLERSHLDHKTSSKTENLRGTAKDEENERRIQQYQQELLFKITGAKDRNSLKQSASANQHSHTHNKSSGPRTPAQ